MSIFRRLYTFTQSLAFFLTRAKTNLDYQRRSYRRVNNRRACAATRPLFSKVPRAQSSIPIRFVASVTGTPKPTDGWSS